MTVAEKDIIELMQTLIKKGDPLADQTVQDMVEAQGIHQFLDFLLQLVRLPVYDQLDDLGLSPKAVEKLQHYFRESSRLPSWADEKKIRKGEELFREQTLLSFMVLAFSSLPACYSCGVPAQILSFTGRLVEQVPRRIPETAQMVIDVMGKGGLTHNSPTVANGIRSLQKVRLIHASIRFLLCYEGTFELPQGASAQEVMQKNAFTGFLIRNRHHGHVESLDLNHSCWDVEKDGVPISQGHMSATLLTFSYLILKGLERMGVQISSEDREAYIHCWNVAGHIMGVSDEFTGRIDDYAHASAYFETILTHFRSGPTEHGHALVSAIIDYARENYRIFTPVLYYLTPVRRMPKIMVYQLSGPITFKSLGLKLDWVDHMVRYPIWLTVKLMGWMKNIRFTQKISEVLFKILMRNMWKMRRGVGVKAGPRQGALALPEAIADKWRIDMPGGGKKKQGLETGIREIS